MLKGLEQAHSKGSACLTILPTLQMGMLNPQSESILEFCNLVALFKLTLQCKAPYVQFTLSLYDN